MFRFAYSRFIWTLLSFMIISVACANTFVIGEVAAPPTPESIPIFAQLGSSSAYVPMKHGQCPPPLIDCATHVLAVSSGNLNLNAKIGLSCPSGKTVQMLKYRLHGNKPYTTVISNTNAKGYQTTITFQPFSADEFATACQQAMGGMWASLNSHPNIEETVKKTVVKNVDVRGRCSGQNGVTRTYPVVLTLSCFDRDFPPPPVR